MIDPLGNACLSHVNSFTTIDELTSTSMRQMGIAHLDGWSLNIGNDIMYVTPQADHHVMDIISQVRLFLFFKSNAYSSYS